MSEVNIKPLADKIVVKVIEETETTPGGIFIPDTAREKSQKGEVLAAGPGFSKYGGTDIKITNTEYKILSVRDVLGVIE